MKTTARRTWQAFGLTVLTLGTWLNAMADQPAKTETGETYTGTVIAVDAKEHALTVKGWLRSKQFHLGQDCKFALLDKAEGMAGDVRPGQRVEVAYIKAHGVLVANRINQQPMRFEGTVKAIDSQRHILTLHRRALDKDFVFGDACQIVLRNNRPGTWSDVQLGHRVTVLYEVPDNIATAREIAQTGATFEGALTAIDTTERTLKARSAFGTRKFILANDCRILLNGKTDGQLRQLKPGDRLRFSYEEINGVNVATRIAPAETGAETVTAQTLER